MDYHDVAERMQGMLGLQSRPLAMAFLPSPPPGVPRIERAAASGCTYWKLAADGAVFYTTAADHFGCPVGAHTHGVELPPPQAKELEGLIGTMTSLGYLRPEEIPQIPARREPFGALVYAPLDRAPCPPDVVLFRGTVRQVMLLQEAAWGAGLRADAPTMGRPACAIVPQAIQSGTGATNLGCIGNRVYTGLGDDELYFAIPGPKLAAVAERLGTIVEANRALEAHHRQRRDA